MAVKTSWAAGDVLLAADLTDTFAGKAANPSLALLNAGGTALTGATTVTVNITAKNFIFVRVVGASSANASSYIIVRFSGDSTNYQNAYFAWQGTASTAPAALTENGIYIGRMGNSAADTVTGYVMLTGGTSAEAKPVVYSGVGSGTSTNAAYVGTGFFSGTSVTSVSVVSSTGNFDAGTVYVYGG